MSSTPLLPTWIPQGHIKFNPSNSKAIISFCSAAPHPDPYQRQLLPSEPWLVAIPASHCFLNIQRGLSDPRPSYIQFSFLGVLNFSLTGIPTSSWKNFLHLESPAWNPSHFLNFISAPEINPSSPGRIPFNSHLLRTYCVPGTGSSPWDKWTKQMKSPTLCST